MNSINKQISRRCRFFNQLLEMYMRQYSKIQSARTMRIFVGVHFWDTEQQILEIDTAKQKNPS